MYKELKNIMNLMDVNLDQKIDNWHDLCSLDFILTHRTAVFDLPRQIGKSTAITELSEAGDIVLHPTRNMMFCHKQYKNVTYSTYNSFIADLRGQSYKPVRTIWFDEMKEEPYKKFPDTISQLLLRNVIDRRSKIIVLRTGVL